MDDAKVVFPAGALDDRKRFRRKRFFIWILFKGICRRVFVIRVRDFVLWPVFAEAVEGL